MTQEEKQQEPGFEQTDVNARLIVVSLSIIGALLIFTLIITVGIQYFLKVVTPTGQAASPLAPARVIPPDPKLQVHPWMELPELRAHEDRILNSYGRDKDGHIHIPIDRAMDAVLSSLPVRPNSPSGITTPGGEGFDASHSLQGLPPQYAEPPQLKGEVQKHAQ